MVLKMTKEEINKKAQEYGIAIKIGYREASNSYLLVGVKGMLCSFRTIKPVHGRLIEEEKINKAAEEILNDLC